MHAFLHEAPAFRVSPHRLFWTLLWPERFATNGTAPFCLRSIFLSNFSAPPSAAFSIWIKFLEGFDWSEVRVSFHALQHLQKLGVLFPMSTWKTKDPITPSTRLLEGGVQEPLGHILFERRCSSCFKKTLMASGIERGQGWCKIVLWFILVMVPTWHGGNQLWDAHGGWSSAGHVKLGKICHSGVIEACRFVPLVQVFMKIMEASVQVLQLYIWMKEISLLS